jgi:hypothetical protein
MSKFHMTRLPYLPQCLSDKAIEMGRSCKRPVEFAHDPVPSLRSSNFLYPIGAKIIQVSLVGRGCYSADVLQLVDFLHSYSVLCRSEGGNCHP